VFDPLHISGKRVAVFGLGDTGLSLARYAFARGAAHVLVLDSRAQPPNESKLRENVPTAQLKTGIFSPDAARSSDILMMSPGVSAYEAAVSNAVARGVPIVGDIDVFARHIPTTTHTIGITGSNGKTTTTALCGALCRAAGLATLVAGNIGTTVLDELTTIERTQKWPDSIVLELSSFQLEATKALRCTSAAVLNYFDYAAVKATVYAQTKRQVVNRDDPLVSTMRRSDREAVTFGQSVPTAQNYGSNKTWLLRGEERLLEVSALTLQGWHNHMNALAALALVEPVCGLSPAMLSALRAFAGLPHRMVVVGTHNEVRYIDDSKATNVGAVVAGLAGLGRKAVLIAGGDGKGQDFSPLRSVVDQHARAVVLIGRDAEKIAAALDGVAAPLRRASSLPDAVRQSAELAQSGDAVLLSPACASLDMFRNYAHRSEVFIAAVQELSHV
jgi:UDP-N-acetylmuramoylalanine--D-glutamate ligase